MILVGLLFAQFPHYANRIGGCSWDGNFYSFFLRLFLEINSTVLLMRVCDKEIEMTV